jgi:hypothetical protein
MANTARSLDVCQVKTRQGDEWVHVRRWLKRSLLGCSEGWLVWLNSPP